MKNRLKISSVRGKAFLAIIVLALLSLLIGGLIVSRVVERYITANYEVAKATTIEGLSYSLEPILESHDYTLVERLITAILEHRYIASIAVYDNNGTLISSIEEEAAASGAVNLETYTISGDGGVVGSLEIGFYTGYISDQVRSTILALISGLAIVFILGGLLFFGLFDRLVSRPLSYINKKVKEMTPENLTARIEQAGDDEFGTLVKSINEMAERLQEYNASRKKTEGMLKQSEEQFRLIFEYAPDAYYLNDLEGNFVNGNKATERLSGYTKEELIGKSFLDLNMLRPEDMQRAAELLMKNASGQSTGPHEFDLVRKDGSQVIVGISTFPVKIRGQALVLAIARDITERKQAEQALLDEATRRRILMEQSRDGIVILNQDGHVYDCNQKFADMVGYPFESMHQLAVFDWEYLYPSERTLEMIRNVDEKGDHFETKHRRKDGSTYDVGISTNAAVFAGQKLIFCICRDITERKQAEEKLRQSRERYRALFDSSVIGALVVDAETMNVVMGNQAAVKMFGFGSAEEATEVNLLDFVPPGDREKDHELLMKEIFEQDSRRAFDLRTVTKDGRKIWISATGARIMHGGRLAGLLSFVDITERKQAEEALRWSEERYRTILEQMDDSYFEVDLGGHLTFVNTSVCRHLGYSKEELMGMSYKNFTAEKDIESVFRVFNEVYRTGEPNSGFPWKIIRKDGTEGFAEATVSPLRNGRGEIIGFRGVGRDITERKHIEEQLIIADRLASIGEMASGIAHELNNPLTGVIGLSQLLVEMNVPEEIKEDLKLLNNEAQRAANIVKGLLAFARKHTPDRGLVNVNDVVSKVLELRAYEQKVSNIETVTNLAPDLPQVLVDYFQLQQIFLNIVTNAEYFMLEAHNKGTLTITTERVENMVRISFADDGPGIPEKDLGHVFDPFFTTKEVGRGTGLGLSISHGMVDAHGGRIYAESEQGKGATFVVELSIRQKEGSDEKQQKK